MCVAQKLKWGNFGRKTFKAQEIKWLNTARLEKARQVLETAESVQ